jgi:diadenosine tetraphosphate (Ap4A) HIT family hydrolase
MYSQMKDCVFCNIPTDKIILESHLSIAFYDTYPVNKGHLLIIPKRHIADYFNLSPDEKTDIWYLVNKAKAYLDNKYSPDGYNVGININEAAGQTIFHCHIHIIPRYTGDIDDPTGGVRCVIPNKRIY